MLVHRGRHRVCLHLNILLDFLLLVALGLVFEVVAGHVDELVLEELAVSERAELLAELEVLGVAVLLALALELVVLGLGELRRQVVLSLEDRDRLGSLRTPLLARLGSQYLRDLLWICLFLVGTPRIRLAFGLLDVCWLFSELLVDVLLGFDRQLLRLDQMSFLQIFFSAFR